MRCRRRRDWDTMLLIQALCLAATLERVSFVVGFVAPSIVPVTSHESSSSQTWCSAGARDAMPISRVRHGAGYARRYRMAIGCVSATKGDSAVPPLTGNARPLALWLDARGADSDDGDWQSFQKAADMVVFDETFADYGPQSPPLHRRLVVKEDGKLVDGDGKLMGASVAITNPKSQGRALSLIGSVDWIQVTCSDWTMIPAENLVSAAGGTPTRIAVELSEPSQVQGAAFALQIGVDALLLRSDSALWSAAVTAREQRQDATKMSTVSRGTSGDEGAASGVASQNMALAVGQVTKTREGGVGDRVCVDLIQILAAGEGMLVGSSAKMLALVHAETFETGFVPARPFRVNAGPVHSYALLADGRTKYLSELCAGDQVLVVDWRGASRAVAIGRLKVETRPMIMVEFQGHSGSTGQLFLQQAETVRLISPTVGGETALGTAGAVDGWRPLSVTDVGGGEALLLREISRGTHVGRAIDAVVTEK